LLLASVGVIADRLVGMPVATEDREHLVRALEADLVGPFDPAVPAEVLLLAPPRWYLTGFLAPVAARDRLDRDSALALERGGRGAFILLLVLLSACEASGRDRAESPTPGANGGSHADVAPVLPVVSPEDRDGFKVDAYTRRCLNELSAKLEHDSSSYFAAVDRLSGLASVSGHRFEISRPEADPRRCREVVATEPAMPEVDAAAERFASGMATLEPLLLEAQGYYARGDHWRDGTARGRELNAAIVPAFEQTIAAENELRTRLGGLRHTLRAARIERLSRDPSREPLLVEERFASQVSIVMAVSRPCRGEPIQPDAAIDRRAAAALLSDYAGIRGGGEEMWEFVRDALDEANGVRSGVFQHCVIVESYHNLSRQLNERGQAWAMPGCQVHDPARPGLGSCFRPL
jgi:hypothetical protein